MAVPPARVLTLAALLALAACGPRGAEQRDRQNASEAEADTVDIPQTVTREPPGTTPMAQRVAVLRLLNKRNGQMREFTLRPGQAIRFGDVILRLRACETTHPGGGTPAPSPRAASSRSSASNSTGPAAAEAPAAPPPSAESNSTR